MNTHLTCDFFDLQPYLQAPHQGLRSAKSGIVLRVGSLQEPLGGLPGLRPEPGNWIPPPIEVVVAPGSPPGGFLLPRRVQRL
jgi:hypothetical protein